MLSSNQSANDHIYNFVIGQAGVSGTQGTVTITPPIVCPEGSDSVWELLNANIPWSFNTINENNNILPLQIIFANPPDVVDDTFQLTPGNYNVTSLFKEIKRLLTIRLGLGSGVTTFNFTQTSNNRLSFGIENDTQHVIIILKTTQNSVMQTLFGFYGYDITMDSDLDPILGDACMNVITTANLAIRCSDVTTNQDSDVFEIQPSSTSSTYKSNILFKFPITQAYPAAIQLTAGSQQIVKRVANKIVSNLTVSLSTDEQKYNDFTYSGIWSFSVRVSFVWKPDIRSPSDQIQYAFLQALRNYSQEQDAKARYHAGVQALRGVQTLEAVRQQLGALDDDGNESEGPTTVDPVQQGLQQ